MARLQLKELGEYISCLSISKAGTAWLDRQTKREYSLNDVRLFMNATQCARTEMGPGLSQADYSGLTYHQLMTAASDAFDRGLLNYSLHTVSSYLNSFKTYLLSKGVLIDNIINVEIFGQREVDNAVEKYKNKKRGTHIKSVVKFFEKLYHYMLGPKQHDDDLNEKLQLRSSIVYRNWWPSDLPAGKSGERFKETVLRRLSRNFHNLNRNEQRKVFDDTTESVRSLSYLTEHERVTLSLRRDFPIKRLFEQNKRLSYEFEDLTKFKTDPFYQDLERDGVCKPDSVKIRLSLAKSYLNYLSIPGDFGGSYQGCGVPIEQLTLAYFVDSESLLSYVNFMYRISGVIHSGITAVLEFAIHLLRPEFGWLWQQPSFVNSLPQRVRDKIEAYGGWSAACEYARNKYKRVLRDIRPRATRSKDSTKRIQPLLDRVNPLKPVIAALKVSRQNLSLDEPPTRESALALQKHLIVSLLTCCPLRGKNWGLLTHTTDNLNSGHLRKTEDGQWWLRIPTSELKNGTTNKELRDLKFVDIKLWSIKWASEHLELLDVFIQRYRPLLTDSIYLFVNSEGGCFNSTSLYHLVKNWTDQYLSDNSPHSTRVKGVKPFGTHLFRNIIATYYAKRGEYDHAAALLLDTESIVRKMYIYDPIESRQRRAFLSMNADFEEHLEG
ncbi:hypothetical protein [Deinococcus aestuarii]|uniref:hypothetical protein n=1 Tax=Deinococcus aestuarii TaxID=2774531 RepID=UPI001C0B4FCD|nr:hypothetical protein [Deinococcus aestuarii]